MVSNLSTHIVYRVLYDQTVTYITFKLVKMHLVRQYVEELNAPEAAEMTRAHRLKLMQHIKFAKMIGYEVPGADELDENTDTVAQLLAAETGGGIRDDPVKAGLRSPFASTQIYLFLSFSFAAPLPRRFQLRYMLNVILGSRVFRTIRRRW